MSWMLGDDKTAAEGESDGRRDANEFGLFGKDDPIFGQEKDSEYGKAYHEAYDNEKTKSMP